MSCPEPGASNESKASLQHSSTPYHAHFPPDLSSSSSAQIPLPERSEVRKECTETVADISDEQKYLDDKTPSKVWSRAVLESLSNQEVRATNTEDASSTALQTNSHMLALVEKISQEVLRKQTALDRSAVGLDQDTVLASTSELLPDEGKEDDGAVDNVRTTNEPSETSQEDSDLKTEMSISTTIEDDETKMDESLHKRLEEGQPHKEQRLRPRNASRRKTLATLSPLNECPKYASELEKEAFSKIRDWKAEFALKLDNVLGQKTQQSGKTKEKRTARVINVPMGLSEDELNSMRSNMLSELRRKSLLGTLLTDQKEHTPKQHINIPTVPFPKRPLANVSPKDLQSSLINELRRLLTAGGKEKTSVVPTDVLKHLKRQPNFQDREKSMRDERLPQYDARVPHSETGFVQSAPLCNVSTPQYHPMYYYPPPPGLWPSVDPQRMAELIRWHDQQREKLSKDLKGLQSNVDKGEAISSTVFGGNNLERVLRSLQDVLDCIFAETITTLGSFERERKGNTSRNSKEKRQVSLGRDVQLVSESKRNVHLIEQREQDQSNRADSSLSNSSIKQFTKGASEDLFEQISSSSSSSYSSLISEIEQTVMLKEEAAKSGGSDANLNESLHDSIWQSIQINDHESFDVVTRRLSSDQSSFLDYSSSSEQSLTATESEEKQWASDIEQELLIPDMQHVSGSNEEFLSYGGDEQDEDGDWYQEENVGSIVESIRDRNVTKQAHRLVAGLLADKIRPGNEDEFTKQNSKANVLLVHQVQTPPPTVSKSLEEPSVNHQVQPGDDAQSVTGNSYQLCREDEFFMQPEQAVVSEENAPERATTLLAHDKQDFLRRNSKQFDKMLTESLDEDKNVNVSEERDVSNATWPEDDRNGPTNSWSYEEEGLSDTWSDTSLDNLSEEEHDEMMYGKSKKVQGNDKGSERMAEEDSNWWEDQSIQVANISDCPLNDMERIRIQNVFLKEELASLQKGLFTKQKLLENKVKELKQLRSSMEELRSYRDLFNESRDQITEIGFEKEELRHRMEQCAREKEELQTRLAQASNEIIKTKQKMSEVCLDNEELQKTVHRVSSEKQASLQQLGLLRSQHKALGQNVDRSNRTWKQKCARLSTEISTKKEELTKLKKDSVSSSQRTKALFLELNAYKGRTESKDTQIGLMKSAVKDLEKENKRLKHERLSIDTSFCHMTEEKCKTATDAKDRCITLEKRLFITESQCKALKQQLFYWSEVWKRECKRLSDENRETQFNHEKMRKNNEKLTRENKLAKLELTSFKQQEEEEYSRVSDLKSTIKELQNEVDNLGIKTGKLESNILKLENEKLGKTNDLEDKEATIAFLRRKVKEHQCQLESSPTVFKKPIQNRPQLQKGPLVIESIIEKEYLQQITSEPKDPEQKELELRENQTETTSNNLQGKTNDTSLNARIMHCRKTEVQNALQENEIQLKEKEKGTFFEQHQIENRLSETKHLNVRKQDIRSARASTQTRAHKEMMVELLLEEKENCLATGKKLDSMKHEVEEVKQITLDSLKHQIKQTQMTNHDLEGLKCMIQVTQERLDHLRNDKVQNDAVLRATQADEMDELKQELRNLQHSVKELLYRWTEPNVCDDQRETYLVSLEASQTLVQRMKEVHNEYRTSKEKELEYLKSWANEQLRIKECEAESIKNKFSIKNEETETHLQRFMMDCEKSLRNQEEKVCNIEDYLNTFFTEVQSMLNTAVGEVSTSQEQLQANLLNFKEKIEEKGDESEEANRQLEHLRSVITTNNTKFESLQKEVLKASEILVKSDCTSLRQLLQFQTNQSRDLGCILRDTFSQDLRKMADLKGILKESFNNINKKLDQMWKEMREIKQTERKERQVLDKCIQTKLEETYNDVTDMKAAAVATIPQCKNTEFANEEDNKKDIIKFCNSCQVVLEAKGKHITVLDRKIRELEKALDHFKNVKKLEIETLKELSKRELDVKDIEIANLRSVALELSFKLNKSGETNRNMGQYGLDPTWDQLMNTPPDFREGELDVIP